MGNGEYEGDHKDKGGPPLPPRRSSASARNPGNLLDEDDGSAQAIPSLHPVRQK